MSTFTEENKNRSEKWQFPFIVKNGSFDSNYFGIWQQLFVIKEAKSGIKIKAKIEGKNVLNVNSQL